MPYFVFECEPPNHFRLLDSFDDYRSARRDVRERRRAFSDETHPKVRMVFAANAEQGRTLLATKRDPRPLGEDS